MTCRKQVRDVSFCGEPALERKIPVSTSYGETLTRQLHIDVYVY